MLTGIYYDIAKYIATNVVDVTCDWEFKDGDLDIDIHIKIPIVKMLESDQTVKPKPAS